MLTTLPRTVDMAAAATIEVFLYRLIATVMPDMARIMTQASAMPLASASDCASLTMMATPVSATTLASRVSSLAFSRNHREGQRGGDEGLGGDDDRHVGDAGGLQRRNERHHAQRRERSDQPAASPQSHEIAQPRPALDQQVKGRDQAAAEQATPEQDGPGVQGQQPREERGGAPGDGRRDHERNAEPAI
jgi:hypothetical protein